MELSKIQKGQKSNPSSGKSVTGNIGGSSYSPSGRRYNSPSYKPRSKSRSPSPADTDPNWRACNEQSTTEKRVKSVSFGERESQTGQGSPQE